MATALRIDDGDWGVTLATAHSWRYPFSSRGDNVSFEYTVSYSVNLTSFTPLGIMTPIGTLLGTAYFVEQGEVRDVGMNLVEFDRIFASVPRNRVEHQSIVHTSQWWQPVEQQLQEVSFVVDGSILYEYFLYVPPPILKFRVIDVFGVLNYVGTPVQTTGAFIVSEDSDVHIYKGGIYERITPYAYRK